MNGEMHQICCIVAAGKRALQYGEPIQYTPAQYENAITFSCLPGKLFSGTKRCIAPRIETWFEFLQSKGLQDIALACPTDVTDKTILGFSNTTEKLGSLLLSKRRNILFRPELAVRSRKATMEHRVFGISLSRFSIGKTPFRKQHRFFSTSVVRYRKIGYSNPV